MVYILFDKKLEGADKNSGSAIKSKIMSNQQLAYELHKLIIRKFKKWKIYSSFKDIIWGTDLVDVQLTRKYNKGIQFALCVINIYSK